MILFTPLLMTIGQVELITLRLNMASKYDNHDHDHAKM